MSDMASAASAERMIEALLFAAATPLCVADLKDRVPHDVDIEVGLRAVARRYAGGGVELICVAGAWRFQTAVDLAFLMTQERETPRRLSKAAQETLAIIAYHQPVTRADIEAVRGVQVSAGTLEALLQLGMIRMRGRRRSPGRPVTWGTTDAFLEHYGLTGLSDLPGVSEMKAAGLLGRDVPADFALPAAAVHSGDEEPFDECEAPDFHQDFLGSDESASKEGL